MLDGPSRRWLTVHFLVNTPMIVATVDAAVAVAIVALLLQVSEASQAAAPESLAVLLLTGAGIVLAWRCS